MNTNRLELFYYPIYKGFRIPPGKELQGMIIDYLTRHPEIKLRKSTFWYFSTVWSGFNSEAIEYYIFMTPERLKGFRDTDGLIGYLGIELYNYLKGGTKLG